MLEFADICITKQNNVIVLLTVGGTIDNSNKTTYLNWVRDTDGNMYYAHDVRLALKQEITIESLNKRFKLLTTRITNKF